MSALPYDIDPDRLAAVSRAVLSSRRNSASVEADASRDWEQAAEFCVLTRLKGLRLFGGRPSIRSPLSRADRLERLEALLGLWASGCCCAVDEQLYADLLQREGG